MSPHRWAAATRLGRVLAAAVIALSASLWSPAAGAADESTGVCDLKMGVGKDAPVDDGVALYSEQTIWWYGYGFPPGATVLGDITAGTVDWGGTGRIQVEANGTFRIPGSFLSFDVTPIVFTISDVANPDECVDSVSGNFLGFVPYFRDIEDSEFLDEIIWLYEAGLTTGCAPSRYCPGRRISRGEAATLLVRGLRLPRTEADFFTDDDGSWYEWSINRLAAAGVATGCAEAQFCPTDLLNRAEMASFLVRALELPPTDTDFFVDDEGLTHEADINALRESGITAGCRRADPTLYCPDRPLRREQMAAMLYRALNAAP